MSHTLTLTGPVTQIEVPALVTSMGAQIASAAEAEITLDASAVTTIDSSAVALLLELSRTAKGAGKRLNIVALAPNLCHLADLYGVRETLVGPAGNGDSTGAAPSQ